MTGSALSFFPIALKPSERRDQCRLLVAKRSAKTKEHRHFYEIANEFRSGDCLVVNTSKVFGARIPFWVGEVRGDILIGKLPRSGEEAPVKLERRFGRLIKRSGGKVRFKDGSEGVIEIGAFDEASGAFLARIVASSLIEQLGETPLPPYILKARRAAGLPELEPSDLERYQCVYAEVPGSAACPTAGLHWTQELLDVLRAKGVLIAKLALHVGFASMMHGVGRDRVPPEECRLEESEAKRINQARRLGGRIIACGTSVVRALESLADERGRVRPWQGPVELFIRPSHPFRVVDAMITNFHLPESTNFLMTQAFLGADWNLASLYALAAAEGYEFYSFGDAMMIL